MALRARACGAPGTEESPGDVSVELVSPSDFNWNLSYNPREVESLGGGDYGGGIDAGSSGSVGITANFSTDSGSIVIDAPMSLTLDFPAADSFRAGDVVSITTSVPTLGAGASITATTPGATLGFTGSLELDTHAFAEICISSCFEVPFFDAIDTSGTYDLVETTAGAVEIPWYIALVTGISGDYRVPESNITSSVVGGSIVGTGSDNSYVDLELDLDMWYVRASGGIVPWGAAVPDFGLGASGSYDIVDIDLDFDISQSQEFTFTPGEVGVSLQFPEPVTFWVYDGVALVSSGTSSTVTFIAGQRVDLVATGNEMDVVPTFTLLDNTFGNETETTYDTAFGTTALSLELDVDAFTIIEDFFWESHWHFDWHWHGSDWHCHAGSVLFRLIDRVA